MYTYKDMADKMHKTDGVFEKWSNPAGVINAPYAIFKEKCGRIYIPHFLLTAETKAQLPPPPSLK